jgi:hypothetical protein
MKIFPSISPVFFLVSSPLYRSNVQIVPAQRPAQRPAQHNDETVELWTKIVTPRTKIVTLKFPNNSKWLRSKSVNPV